MSGRKMQWKKNFKKIFAQKTFWKKGKKILGQKIFRKKTTKILGPKIFFRKVKICWVEKCNGKKSFKNIGSKNILKKI